MKTDILILILMVLVAILSIVVGALAIKLQETFFAIFSFLVALTISIMGYMHLKNINP